MVRLFCCFYQIDANQSIKVMKRVLTVVRAARKTNGIFFEVPNFMSMCRRAVRVKLNLKENEK